MNSKELDKKLTELGACTDGRNFAKGKTLEKAWAECDRPDWMLWIYRRASNYSKLQVVQIAIFVAELVIHIFEAKYPTDERPRKAIEAAKKCLETPSDETYSASANAAASAYAAAAYYTNGSAYVSAAASYAAAYSANAAACSADNANIYATATAYEATKASRNDIRKKISDYIREVIPVITL